MGKKLWLFVIVMILGCGYSSRDNPFICNCKHKNISDIYRFLENTYINKEPLVVGLNSTSFAREVDWSHMEVEITGSKNASIKWKDCDLFNLNAPYASNAELEAIANEITNYKNNCIVAVSRLGKTITFRTSFMDSSFTDLKRNDTSYIDYFYSEEDSSSPYVHIVMCLESDSIYKETTALFANRVTINPLGGNCFYFRRSCRVE